MSEVRRVQFALSVDALMQQWARQEGGPAGSAVIATTEIAGRLRGGVEWRQDNSISVGVLARPLALEPPAVDLGWLAASIGAASALDLVTGGRHDCQWPDRVARPPTAEGVGQFEVAISSVGQLGPGRIDHVIMIVRIVGLSHVAADLAAALVDELRASALLLDEPSELVQRYRDVCSTLGRQVSMSLLPSGSTRGLARDIGRYGGLVLESPTGLVESVSVSALGRLEMIDN